MYLTYLRYLSDLALASKGGELLTHTPDTISFPQTQHNAQHTTPNDVDHRQHCARSDRQKVFHPPRVRPTAPPQLSAPTCDG